MTDHNATHTPSKSYQRFDLGQRIEHGIFLVSFSLLGLTGLIQKFAESPISLFFLRLFGGIEGARNIHHVSAIVMLIVSLYHVLELLYRIIVLRSRWTMMPWLDDVKHVLQDVLYYLGIRKEHAHYGQFNYAEKAEYLAVVWGTVLMALTGFLMWNPILATRFLPGEAIPAAKAAHGAEAVLAVAAIVLWHFYHVHVKMFNKSMFNGKMSQHEMEDEHPAQLAEIETKQKVIIPPQELRKRQMIYAPIAAVIVIGFGIFNYFFLGYESTAITTVPQGETAQIFAPVTPSPRPTVTIAPTATPGEGVSSNSWAGNYEALFRNRCSTCHGVTKVGGYSLATYQDALGKTNNGIGIVPGDPEKSMLVQIQSAGSHPGQLTDEELQNVIEWIKAGAPEK
jgi:cytochrome b subunit of formate dehydrogenase/mono/diheme cytochrome c family protein